MIPKTEDTSDREIVISRVVNAPRELVWDAMTKPEHVVHWWGPNGFTTTMDETDVRVGGRWKHIMHGPDGTDYLNEKVFREVVKPERLVFTHGGGRKEDVNDVQAVATWTFEVVEKKKTKVTIRMVFPTAEERNRIVEKYGAIEGGNQTLAKLAAFLEDAPSDCDFVISRTFAAPRELLWKAWTDPRKMEQWWGPKGFANAACEIDVRVGGKWRTVMRSPEGTEYPCHGVYREIIELEKLVMTLDCAGHPEEWFDQVLPDRDRTKKPSLTMVQTTTFEKLGDKTKLIIRTRLESKEIRDKMVKMGMSEGWSQSLDRLQECSSGL